MEKQDSRKLLAQYNELYKRSDDVYRTLARHYGLSECAFWILYVMSEEGGAFTQSMLRDKLSISKQTINSALKNLEGMGYIRLEAVKGNQKSKEIIVTEAGLIFTAETVEKVILMDMQAFEEFTAEEQGLFFLLFTKYVRRLERASQILLEDKHCKGNGFTEMN